MLSTPQPKMMQYIRPLRVPLGTLASGDRRPKNVRVFPVITAELELGNIQRHVFGADLMEAANEAALEDRPEAFNRIRVDRANNVLANAAIHGPVRVSVAAPVT